MKKVLLTIGAISLLSMSSIASTDGKMKSMMKDVFFESCTQEMIVGFLGEGFDPENMDEGDDVILEGIGEYCSCAADKVIDKLSIEELEIYAEADTTEGLEEDMEKIDAKIDKITKPCLDDLLQKFGLAE